MEIKKIKDFNLYNKKIIVRLDLNVPLDQGSITDDSRIKAALPTLKYLLANNNAVICLSHLGRPKNKVVEELRLKPVGIRLSELLKQEVLIVDEVAGDKVERSLSNLKFGELALLENTRFDAGETANDPHLAAQWAKYGDFFVNDAFGTAHRAHASNVGLAKLLPAAAGFLLEKEIEALAPLAQGQVKRPYAAILGGKKISDKLGVIEALLDKVDLLLLGGGMANTFLASLGWEMGSSLVETSLLDQAKKILEKGAKDGKEIMLPRDLMVCTATDGTGDCEMILTPPISEGWIAVDVGPQTIDYYKDALSKAQTVFWNGPLGIFELAAFARGTNKIANFLADLDAYTVIGGGDSSAAVFKAGVDAKINHISTGGGASLEFLEKGDLPGIAVLRRDS